MTATNYDHAVPSIWRYSLAGSMTAAVALLLIDISNGNSPRIPESLLIAYLVAQFIALRLGRLEGYRIAPTDRKRLLLQYAGLTGIFFVVIFAITLYRNPSANAAYFNLLIDWIPYPAFLYMYTRDGFIKRYIPQDKVAPTLANKRSRYLNKVYRIIVAQMLLGSLLALVTPTNILDYPWAQEWAEFILGFVAPKMMSALSGYPDSQVVLFYHAAMLATWPIFALEGILLIYTAPRGLGKLSTNSQYKVNTTMLTLVVAYLFVAAIFLMISDTLSQGVLYFMSQPIHSFRPRDVAGSIVMVDIWQNTPRFGLLLTSFVWAFPTAIVFVLATAPGVLRMYWGVVPWIFKGK